MRLSSRSLGLAAVVASSAGFALFGYECVRSASNTLFKLSYGVENLAGVMAMAPLAVLAALGLYNVSLTRLGPRRTLFWSSLLSGALILLCYVGVEAGYRIFSIVLYWIREAYIVLLIEQYWSFLHSHLTQQDEKKLNGPIIGISSLGAVAGGILVSQLAGRLGTPAMLLFAASALIPAALVSDWAYRYFGDPRGMEEALPLAREKSPLLGVGLFRHSRFLLLVFCLVLITQVVSAVLGLNFQESLQTAFPDRDTQTAFSGKFYAGLNGAAAVFQFLITPLLLRWISFFWIHLGIALVHVASCTYLLAEPSLASAGLAYLLFKAFDYSLFRAAKEILYVPLSFDVRYRAKEFIDVFGYRFGKGASSAALYLFQKAGVAVAALYAPLALVASFIWVGIVFGLFKGRVQPGTSLTDNAKRSQPLNA